MLTPTPEQISPRESFIMQHEAEEEAKNREFGIRMKELDIQQQKLEARWSSWLKIPLTVIKLPVFCIMALGYVVNAIRKIEPSENFWKMLK